MADSVLETTADPDGLSFYGLIKALEGVKKLLQRADHALAAKAPRPEDQAIADRKEELLAAQAQLRKALGGLVEKPELTKRERPLAEGFLQEQLTKLQGDSTDPKAAKKVERLQELLTGLRGAAPVPESQEVRGLEASIKKLEVEWKEVEPLHKKWQDGRHNFKSNDDLQAFRRRFEDCRRGRETSAEKLEKALCCRRDAAASKAAAAAEAAAAAAGVGWSAVAKKAAPATPSGWRRSAGQPAAAAASVWAAGLSMAHRRLAEVGARVRQEAAPAEAAPVGPASTTSPAEAATRAAPAGPPGAPPPPPPPKPAPPLPKTWAAVAAPAAQVVPKGPPPLPTELVGAAGPGATAGGFAAARGAGQAARNAPKRWGVPVPAASDGDWEEPATASAGQAAPATYAASAKKRGKTKKRKGGAAGDDEDADDTATAAPTSAAPTRGAAAAAWAAAVEAAISGSLLQEVLGREAWAAAPDAAAAGDRLLDLASRLPWSSPLGLVLPLDWKEFVSLEVDGGPKRTSKRGLAPWVLRLQRTVPHLLAHYVTILFMLTLLHSLSHFGVLAWAAAAQATLLLAPPEALPAVSLAARARLLQVAHLLLWVAFVRSIWQLHLLVKLLTAAVVAVHAYVVAEVAAA